MENVGPLTIRIKKNADGRTSLSCTRADGTTTWQRQEGAQAAFFPRHDLTHYAVETVLGHGKGFYGLVAAGWDLSDFGKPWPRGRLPLDANLTEMIVGFAQRRRPRSRQANARRAIRALGGGSAGRRVGVAIRAGDVSLPVAASDLLT